jgi:hypothetical protein
MLMIGIDCTAQFALGLTELYCPVCSWADPVCSWAAQFALGLTNFVPMLVIDWSLLVSIYLLKRSVFKLEECFG